MLQEVTFYIIYCWYTVDFNVLWPPDKLVVINSSMPHNLSATNLSASVIRKSVKCLLCTVQGSKRAEINHTIKCQQHKQEALYVIRTSIAGGNYIARSSVAANFKPVYTQAVWLHVATESTLKLDGYNQKSCDSRLNKPFTNSFSQAA